MRTGSIYIIRNTVNDKVYVGQTTMSVHQRFMCHMKPSTLKQKRNYKLYNAVQKYGKEVFYVETLEEKVPIDRINEREIYYISKFDSYNSGYNSTKGGDGRIFNKMDNERKVIDMALSGSTVKEIAKTFNVHTATISRTLSRLNIRMTLKASEEDLKALLDKGTSNKEIAQYFHIDDYTVTRLLKRYHLERYKKRVTKRTDFDYESIHNDYDNQMPISEICQKYDISRTTFYRISSSWELRPQIYKHKIRYHSS